MYQINKKYYVIIYTKNLRVKKTAENIVEYRKENGKISTREEVKKIKGIGPKSYEQAIGFLKILDSKNPLDKTFIHPDNYSKILTLLKSLNE